MHCASGSLVLGGGIQPHIDPKMGEDPLEACGLEHLIG